MFLYLMSGTPTFAEPRDQDRILYRSLLHDMMHAGVSLIRTLELRAVNATLDNSNQAVDTALAFERISRAVRRSIMLAEKIAEPTPPSEPTQAPQPRQNPDADRPEPRDTDRPNAEDQPESPNREHHDGRDEREDREDSEDPGDAAFAQRPIPDQIAAIQRDLTAISPPPPPPPPPASESRPRPAPEKPIPPNPPLQDRSHPTPAPPWRPSG